jgi:hypothetical protein
MENAMKRVKKPATITPMMRFVIIVNPGNEYLTLKQNLLKRYSEFESSQVPWRIIYDRIINRGFSIEVFQNVS